MKVWVERSDMTGWNGRIKWIDIVQLNTERAIGKNKVHLGHGETISMMRIKNFKRHFGFTPRKGSSKQYELLLKDIL